VGKGTNFLDWFVKSVKSPSILSVGIFALYLMNHFEIPVRFQFISESINLMVSYIFVLALSIFSLISSKYIKINLIKSILRVFWFIVLSISFISLLMEIPSLSGGGPEKDLQLKQYIRIGTESYYRMYFDQATPLFPSFVFINYEIDIFPGVKIVKHIWSSSVYCCEVAMVARLNGRVDIVSLPTSRALAQLNSTN